MARHSPSLVWPSIVQHFLDWALRPSKRSRHKSRHTLLFTTHKHCRRDIRLVGGTEHQTAIITLRRTWIAEKGYFSNTIFLIKKKREQFVLNPMHIFFFTVELALFMHNLCACLHYTSHWIVCSCFKFINKLYIQNNTQSIYTVTHISCLHGNN